MNIDRLIDQKKEQLAKQHFIEFTDEEISDIPPEDVHDLIRRLEGCCLMKLPPFEISFFEWLRHADPPVWNDLWADEENEYLVSVDFLRQLHNQRSGFPICDLQDEDNFWFCKQHLKPQAVEMIPDILDKLENKKKLKLHEAFILAVHTSPIDVWHFAYNYKLKLQTMKSLIEELDMRGLIVHLTDSEDLVRYIEKY